VELLCHRV